MEYEMKCNRTDRLLDDTDWGPEGFHVGSDVWFLHAVDLFLLPTQGDEPEYEKLR